LISRFSAATQKKLLASQLAPDTSRIISEVLLSGIHKNEIFGPIVESRAAYRLVDDFFMGFEDEVSARKCLDALRRALWDYNLHLNESKTGLIQSSGSWVTSAWRVSMIWSRVI
jgi:hypothetical protein